MGLLLLIVFLLAIRKRFYRRNPAATAMGCWVLLTALPVLVLRLPAGFQYSLVMRYKIYSDLFLICGYFCLVDMVKAAKPSRQHALFAISSVIAICMWLGSDVLGYRYLIKRQQRVALGLQTFVEDRTQSPQITVSGDPIDAAQNERARNTLATALQTGIYHLPAPSRF